MGKISMSKGIFATLLVGSLLLFFSLFCFTWMLTNFGMNDADHEQFDSDVNNFTTPVPITYQTITILDKQNIERSLLSDIYNVVYRTPNGEVTKIDNMSIFYRVEVGHTYNASFKGNWFQNIVGEV